MKERMSVFGTPNTPHNQAIAGAHASAGTPGVRPTVKGKPPGNPARKTDEYIAGAEGAAGVDRARRLAGNDQEDAREDHQEHPTYSSRGKDQREGGSLDTSG